MLLAGKLPLFGSIGKCHTSNGVTIEPASASYNKIMLLITSFVGSGGGWGKITAVQKIGLRYICDSHDYLPRA